MITVLKFYANWCKPCAILSGRLEEFEDIITDINIEKEPEVSRQYHVRQVPTLVFLKDDVVVHRLTGLITAKEFQTVLDEINDSKEIVIEDIEVIEDNPKEE